MKSSKPAGPLASTSAAASSASSPRLRNAQKNTALYELHQLVRVLQPQVGGIVEVDLLGIAGLGQCLEVPRLGESAVHGEYGTRAPADAAGILNPPVASRATGEATKLHASEMNLTILCSSFPRRVTPAPRWTAMSRCALETSLPMNPSLCRGVLCTHIAPS